MKSIVDRLEEYRLANKLSKAEMARRMGAAAQQNYQNWVMRDSLPKSYYAKAAELLGDAGPLGDSPPARHYQDSLFSLLSPEEQRDLVLTLLGELDQDSRLAALRFLLQDQER